MAKISKAGKTEDGLRCPKCGGTQFTAKRSGAKKVLLAPMAFLLLFTRRRHVRCVTCGEVFRRG